MQHNCSEIKVAVQRIHPADIAGPHLETSASAPELDRQACAAMASNTPDWVKAPYLGKTLHDVSTPSAVLDLAKLEVNCQRMLDATERLGLEWRAHIKTHKVCLGSSCCAVFEPLC